MHVAISFLLYFVFIASLHFIPYACHTNATLRFDFIFVFSFPVKSTPYIYILYIYVFIYMYAYIINPLCITLVVCLPRLFVYQLTARVCLYLSVLQHAATVATLPALKNPFFATTKKRLDQRERGAPTSFSKFNAVSAASCVCAFICIFLLAACSLQYAAVNTTRRKLILVNFR